VSNIQGKGKKFELGHEKPNASLAQAKRSDVNKENERASSSLGIDKDVDGEPLSVDKASSPVEGVSMSQATLLPGRNMVEEKCENQKLEFQSRNEKSVDDLQQSTLNDSNKKRVVKVDGTSGSSTRVMGHFQSDKKLEHGKHNKLKEPSLKKTREEMVQAIPDSEVGKKIQKCEPDKISVSSIHVVLVLMMAHRTIDIITDNRTFFHIYSRFLCKHYASHCEFGIHPN
jgi:hypothetical protein